MMKRLIPALLLLVPVMAWAKPMIQLHWDSTQAKMGQPVTLTVTARDMPDVYGVQMTLHADPSAVSISKDKAGKPVTKGTFFSDQKGIELNNKFNPKTGDTTWVYSLMRPATSVKGNGAIATLKVVPKKAGKLVMAIKDVKFGTAQGQVIVPDVQQAGALNIKAGNFLSMQPAAIFGQKKQDTGSTVAAGINPLWIAVGVLGGICLVMAVLLLKKARTA